MGKQGKSGLKDMVVVDVRITDVGTLPAKYFLHDEVISALQRVVRSDVVVHGNPMPPGAEAILSNANSLVPAKVLAAHQDIKYKAQRAVGPVLQVVAGVIIAIGVCMLFYGVWRILRG